MRNGTDTAHDRSDPGEEAPAKLQRKHPPIFRCILFPSTMHHANKPDESPRAGQPAGNGFLVKLQFGPAFESFGCDEAENRQHHEHKAKPRQNSHSRGKTTPERVPQ